MLAGCPGLHQAHSKSANCLELAVTQHHVHCRTIAAYMKSGICISLLLLVVFLSGCGSTQPLFLGGTWVFTITPSGSTSEVIQGSATLTQLGNSIFGPVTFSGSGTSCGTQGMMSGTVNGNAVSLHLTQSQNTLSLTGLVTGGPPLTYNALGKYTASMGQCLQNGGTGAWSAFLTPNNASGF